MNSEPNGAASNPQSEPALCAHNCGFYGNPSTMNLCSKCYRDLCPKQDPMPPAPESAVEEISLSFTSMAVSENTKNTPWCNFFQFVAGESVRSCNKKVRLMGFQCKCGNTFCADHRLPEKHECSFDYNCVGRHNVLKLIR